MSTSTLEHPPQTASAATPEQVGQPPLPAGERLREFNNTYGEYNPPTVDVLREARDTLDYDIVPTSSGEYEDVDGNFVDMDTLDEADRKSDPKSYILDAAGEARAVAAMHAIDPSKLSDETLPQYEEFADYARDQGADEDAIFPAYQALALNKLKLSKDLKKEVYGIEPEEPKVRKPLGRVGTTRTQGEIQQLLGVSQRTRETEDALLREELQGLAPKQRREAEARLRAQGVEVPSSDGTNENAGERRRGGAWRRRIGHAVVNGLQQYATASTGFVPEAVDSQIENSNDDTVVIKRVNADEANTNDPVELYRERQAERLREAGREIRSEQRQERRERAAARARRVGRAVLGTMENVRSVALGTYIPEAAAPQVDLSDADNGQPEIATGGRTPDNGQVHGDTNAWLWDQFPGVTEAANTTQAPNEQSRPHDPHPDDDDIDLPV